VTKTCGVNEDNEWASADESQRLTFTSWTFDEKEVACIHLPNCNHCNHCDPNSLLMAEIAKIIVNPIKPNPQPIISAPTFSLAAKSTSLSDDEYNQYNMSLSSIQDPINFESIPVLTTQPCAPTLPQPIAPPAHLALRSTTEPSLQIHFDIMVTKQLEKNKIDKSKFLNCVVMMLARSCVACWCHLQVL
jgi:hypothetical protein